jgi:hypothetical protein
VSENGNYFNTLDDVLLVFPLLLQQVGFDPVRRAMVSVP